MVAVARGIEVGGVARLFHKVGDVEESVALEANVHKGGLHTGEDASDFAVVNGTSEGIFVLALVVDLGQGVVFDDCQARLVGRAGYIYFF